MDIEKKFNNFLFINTRKTKPDGRPLYAYKCSEKYYSLFKEYVKTQLQNNKTKSYLFSILFCLYASETWRRKHESGKWKWDTIFLGICEESPPSSSIYRWVEKGLKYWNRNIIKGNNDQKLYLVTIACEGGLPLLLLRKENTRLKRFFKQLLEQYHYKRQLPYCDIQKIAITIATNFLPRSLRNDVVFNLSSDLVQKVVDLQEKIIDANDPIAELDSKYEGWRNDLPLPLEDKTVELLLNNLVIDAKQLSKKMHLDLKWNFYLVQKNNQWFVEKRLNLSKIIPGSLLQKWPNKDQIPYRMRILMDSSNGIEPLALLTRIHSENNEVLFRCETLNRKGIAISDKRILEDVRLILTDGTFESEIPSTGGQALGDLPWVFHDNNGQLELLGEGTICSKNEILTILIPSGGKSSTNKNDTEFIGNVYDVQREIYKIIGDYEWQHPELGNCFIKSSATDIKNDKFVINGEKIHGTTERIPPYLGMPELYIEENNKKLKNISLEWASFGTGNPVWSTNNDDCSGLVWVRYSNSDGYQLLRRKIRVLPKTTQIKITKTGLNDEPGIIKIIGLSNAEISCLNEQCKCFRLSNNDFEIHCFANSSYLITNFTVRIEWSDSRFMELQLPFPCAGGAFIYAGKHLETNEYVSISRLSAMQAVAQATKTNQRFSLNVKIKTKHRFYYENDIRIPQYKHYHDLEFQENFSLEKDGRNIFYLHRIQESIKSLLSLTCEIDSLAEISIIQDGNISMAKIEVGSFDLWFDIDHENQLLKIHKDCINRLDNISNVSVTITPLWDPSSYCKELQMLSDNLMWQLPDDLTPGPYWLLGEENNVASFRPILWNIPGVIDSCNSLIEKAIRELKKSERKQLLKQWIQEISNDPDHKEWEYFFNYLELIIPYPASYLELFSSMIEFPEAMVMALLKSSDEHFEAIWSLSYQLPFSWYLVPSDIWLTASRLYFQSIQKELVTIDSNGDILFSFFESFQEKLIIRRPFFKQICDWLCQDIFPDKQLQNSELILANKAPAIIEKFINTQEQYFQSRYGPDKDFPDGPEIMNYTKNADYPDKYKYSHLSPQMRPIRCAPFVAAYICLNGLKYNQNLLFEIKKLRHFDKEWFAQAYANALCLGLSQK